MGNILCFACLNEDDRAAEQNDRGALVEKAVEQQLQQPSEHPGSINHGLCVPENVLADDKEGGGQINPPLNVASAGPSRIVITTNSLVPPAPVAIKNITFQTLEQMMEDIQLLGEIGSGGFAVVYKGVYQGGDVAVKLAVTSITDETGMHEALVSPQLRHPHVVQTYVTRGSQLTAEYIEEVCKRPAAAPKRSLLPALPSCPSEDGLGAPRKISHDRQGWREVLLRIGALPDKCLLMLVQELGDHGSLLRAIRRGVFRIKKDDDDAIVTKRVLLRTAAEICRGMIHLHSVSVIHGDLKPANILLFRSRTDRRGFIAKVADFGLSRLLKPDTNKVDATSLGTVIYSSPESMKGCNFKSSDVYSFGMMVWELLTGRRPYESLTAVRVLMGVSMGGMRPDWPEEWPELCALGKRCLNEDLEKRPTFRELEKELVAMEEALRAQSKLRSAQLQLARSTLSRVPQESVLSGIREAQQDQEPKDDATADEPGQKSNGPSPDMEECITPVTRTASDAAAHDGACGRSAGPNGQLPGGPDSPAAHSEPRAADIMLILMGSVSTSDVMASRLSVDPTDYANVSPWTAAGAAAYLDCHPEDAMEGDDEEKR